MHLQGQQNPACESRPGHLEPCHWCVWKPVLSSLSYVQYQQNDCVYVPYTIHAEIYHERACEFQQMKLLLANVCGRILQAQARVTEV